MTELRQALRALARQPAFALVAIATLALGIGATTAIWSLVHAVLLRPLPYPEPDRLAILWENDRLRGTDRESASYPDYLDLAAQSTSWQALAALQSQAHTLTGIGDEPLRVTALAVSPSVHDVLALPPALGRGFSAADGSPESPRVALLGEAFWRERLGADPGVLGRTLRIDGMPYEIAGVVPAATELIDGPAQVWIPLTGAERTATARGVHNVFLIGRLRNGVAREQAQAEATAIMARLEAAYPEENQG